MEFIARSLPDAAWHLLASVPLHLTNLWPPTHTEITTAIAALLVGVVVGITGMGGGALMTPALIFLGVGQVSSIVTADLTAAAIYKTSGACVHWREGSPNLRLALWLVLGSVPMAFLGPHLIHWMNPQRGVDACLAGCIGVAALLAAATYAWRIYMELHRRAKIGVPPRTGECVIRPLPTIAIGALGGLLVGVTSVGSGSIIMIALLMLYPGLPAVQLVGTDLVQAVPLVLSGAISNIWVNGLDLSIAVPLIIGSVPGCMLGSKIAPCMRGSYIRRGIVVVLTMSGLALIDKAGWAPMAAGGGETHPKMIALLGLMMLLLAPILRGLLQRSIGLPPARSQAVERAHEVETLKC